MKITRQIKGVDVTVMAKRSGRAYYYVAVASTLPKPTSIFGRKETLVEAICGGFNRASTTIGTNYAENFR